MGCIDMRQRAQFIAASKSPSGPEHCIGAMDWSGSSIRYRLALGLRTPVAGRENTVVNVCFRFASWTGQSTVILRAMSIVLHVTVPCLDVMSVHDLGACNPQPCQLHQISKSSI